ncbi:MAG: HlyD family efflux transporter periplasmic adaptor subunit, partial [Planctomycetota bacterium]
MTRTESNGTDHEDGSPSQQEQNESFPPETNTDTTDLNGQQPSIKAVDTEAVRSAGTPPESSHSGKLATDRLRMERVLSVAAVLCLILVAVIVATQIKSADGNVASSSDFLFKEVNVGVTPVRLLKSPDLMSSYRGTVIPRREAALAFRRSGRIESIQVEAGDFVEKGDVLAELDTSDLEAQLLVSESELAVAEAEYEEALKGPRAQTISAAEARVAQLQAQELSAQARLKRQEELILSRATSTELLETEQFAVRRLRAAIMEAESQLEELQEGTRREQILAAKSRVNRSEAAVKLVRVDLSDSRLVAPFDCVIGQRHLDEGAMASPDAAALSIIEKPPLEARFGLPSNVARSLAIGDSVEISVGMGASSSDHPTCGASIVRLQPRVDPVTRTREVVVQFDSEDVSYVGEPATLWLPWSADNNVMSTSTNQTQVWVPSTALVRNVRGLWGLYLLRQKNDEFKQPGS